MVACGDMGCGDMVARGGTFLFRGEPEFDGHGPWVNVRVTRATRATRATARLKSRVKVRRSLRV